MAGSYSRDSLKCLIFLLQGFKPVFQVSGYIGLFLLGLRLLVPEHEWHQCIKEQIERDGQQLNSNKTKI